MSRTLPSCLPTAAELPPADNAHEGLASLPEKRRVTQLDIARAAGVHNTTVSLALRNSPALPEATRKRVQMIAEQLGYRPDPALRALAAYRRGVAVHRRTETIAYVTGGAVRIDGRENQAAQQAYVGASRKAAECGYELEHFWLGEPGMNPRRLGGMLFHRGITGLLLAPDTADAQEPLEFDWGKLSVVCLGCSSQTESLHRVSSDLAHAMRLSLRKIAGAGYRRPVLIVSTTRDQAADDALSMGFLAERAKLGMEALPIHFYPGADAEMNPMDLGCFLRESRPDVVVGFSRSLTRPIESLGFRIPKDFAFVDPLLETVNPGFAGVVAAGERLGEMAAELLFWQMQQNVRGLPASPTTTLLRGTWCEGPSLPQARIDGSEPLERSPGRDERKQRQANAA